MSVNRKVTVPDGSSTATPPLCHRRSQQRAEATMANLQASFHSDVLVRSLSVCERRHQAIRCRPPAAAQAAADFGRSTCRSGNTTARPNTVLDAGEDDAQRHDGACQVEFAPTSPRRSRRLHYPAATSPDDGSARTRVLAIASGRNGTSMTLLATARRRLSAAVIGHLRRLPLCITRQRCSNPRMADMTPAVGSGLQLRISNAMSTRENGYVNSHRTPRSNNRPTGSHDQCRTASRPLVVFAATRARRSSGRGGVQRRACGRRRSRRARGPIRAGGRLPGGSHRATGARPGGALRLPRGLGR